MQSVSTSDKQFLDYLEDKRNYIDRQLASKSDAVLRIPGTWVEPLQQYLLQRGYDSEIIKKSSRLSRFLFQNPFSYSLRVARRREPETE